MFIFHVNAAYRALCNSEPTYCNNLSKKSYFDLKINFLVFFSLYFRDFHPFHHNPKFFNLAKYLGCLALNEFGIYTNLINCNSHKFYLLTPSHFFNLKIQIFCTISTLTVCETTWTADRKQNVFTPPSKYIPCRGMKTFENLAKKSKYATLRLQIKFSVYNLAFIS